MSMQAIAWRLMSEEDYGDYIVQQFEEPNMTKIDHGYTCPEDWDDDEIGNELIAALGLKKDKVRGRVDTRMGDKSPCGLTRTIEAIIEGARRRQA